ncbi:origin recognition complex subunit 4 isoform X1 [Dermacentor andersoni]|uniref:origin recognition complex subunit 4 isoform X1 n=1 Tax=Dermacentor andersoni TaxID=34620 RepID=UPI002417786F|nr:origin recognition complex subunit 4-like isoform X1 [Dermacentor andersoni]
MTSGRYAARKSASSSDAGTATWISEVKKCLLRNLDTQAKPDLLKSYSEQKRVLEELLSRAVKLGESNSVLVVGPRGCGKTSLILAVLDSVSRHQDILSNFLLVKLNGFTHTDDKIALKDITRQLQLENVVGDRVFGSFSENLTFLLECLKSGDQQSKTIVFVVDEFDLFCYHKNQTLLYNLFDVAQSAQAPILVIGITCRLDAVELLEKRVKSRFSHRQLHLFPNFSFEEYLGIMVDHLSLPSNFPNNKLREEWNASIKSLVQAFAQESAVRTALQRLYSTNKDIRAMQYLLLPPVMRLSEKNPKLDAVHLLESQRQQLEDPNVALLKGLSMLELSLVVAMVYLTKLYDGEPFNFEMVYKEFLKFATGKSSLETSKPVVMKAFQQLEALEFVQPVSRSLASVQYEFRLMQLLVDPSQVHEVVHRSSSLPTELAHWAVSVVGS